MPTRLRWLMLGANDAADDEITPAFCLPDASWGLVVLGASGSAWTASIRIFSRYVSANVLGMVALSVYILADTYFIANGVGYQGLAALNFALVLYTVLSATGLLLGIGGSTLFQMSRAVADKDEANRVFTNALFCVLFFTILFVLVMEVFAQPFAGLLGASEENIGLTVTYVRTIFAFAPLFLLNATLLPFVRNDGSPRIAMAGMVAGSLLNIVLDWLFIYEFGWGMFGAAFATGFAPLTSLLILSSHFLMRLSSFKPVRCLPSLSLVGRMMALGFSSFAVELSGGVVLLVLNLIILHFAGTVGVAAYGIVANFAFVATALFVGVAQGLQPLATQAFALKDKPEMNRILILALVLSVLMALILYAVVFAFAWPLADAFNRDGTEQLSVYAVEGMRVYFVGYFFAGVNIVVAAYLSAVSHPGFGLTVSIMRGFVLLLTCVFVLSALFGMEGVWAAFPAAECVCTFGILLVWGIMRLRFRSPR